MSENHNLTQSAGGATTILDTDGKGKGKEVDPSPQTSDTPEEEEDILGKYPLESFPSPPADGFWHVRQANDNDSTPSALPNTDSSLKFNPPLDPPLMALTYPPPPPLADDPTWYAKMFSEVHRHRDHLNRQLDLAHREAVTALAQVTLAQVELSEEINQMQNFLDRVAFVAGKNFVRKLLGSVQCALEEGEDAADESEEEQRNADDSNESDDEGSEEHQAGAKNENPSGSGDESNGDEQDSDDENSCGINAESRGMSENGSCNQPPEEGEEASSPRRKTNADYKICSGDNNGRSQRSSQSPSPIPENLNRKRPREEDEDEEGSPNSSPRKKFKETLAESHPTSTSHAVRDDDESVLPHVWSPEDDEVDPEPNSDEEYSESEVEDSLFLGESEPVTPPLPGPSMPRSLLEISRDPRRLRQNSRGEPELYIPGR